jgi:hypothetical protein
MGVKAASFSIGARAIFGKMGQNYLLFSSLQDRQQSVGDAINSTGRVQIHNDYCGNSMPLIRKQQRRKLV